MFRKKSISFLILLAIMVFFASVVSAQTYRPNPVDGGNKWYFSFYRDTSTSHSLIGSFEFCFRYIGPSGTHDRYEWYSCTLPWRGIAQQEGDQIFMHGEFGFGNTIHDGAQWEIASKDQGEGHWRHWREDSGFGTSDIFLNIMNYRRGKCTCQGPLFGTFGFAAEDSASPLLGPTSTISTDDTPFSFIYTLP